MHKHLEVKWPQSWMKLHKGQGGVGSPLIPYKRKIEDYETFFGNINIQLIVANPRYSRLGSGEHFMWCTHSH
jgi:hypothetical protein